MSDLYKKDFYAWTTEQAALLRAGKLSAADIANIAEEIESMGRSQKRELISRLRVLLAHLLKWQFQPEGRSSEWRGTITEQRQQCADLLRDNPSLRPLLAEFAADACDGALRIAMNETGITRAIFPIMCPWPIAQVMDEDFWPEAS
jgi:hypothetical protein